MAGKKAEEIDSELLAKLIGEGQVIQNTGFPPYWVPEIGASFKAMVEDKDLARDSDEAEEMTSGNFTRYKFMANHEILCKTGPAASVEDVVVQAGEGFTTSAYGSLNLDDYIGFDVQIIVTGNRKLPGNKASKGAPRDLWTFVVTTDANTDRQIKALKRASANAKREFLQKRRLQGFSVNTLPNGKGDKVVEGKLEAKDAVPIT